MVKLGNIFEIRSGYTFRDSIADLDAGTVAVIQAGDINAARLAEVPRIQSVGEKHLLKEGDIVLSSRGGTVARTITRDILPAVAASSVFILRPLAPEMNTRFVTRYLNSQSGQADISKIISGAYIKTIRKADLAEISLPLPPVSTQQSIVQLGEAIDRHRDLIRLKEQLLGNIYDQAIRKAGKVS